MLLLTEFRMEEYWDGTYEPICITPSDTLWKTTFHVGSMSLFFAVPLLLLIALYSVIARHLIVYPGAVASSHQRHAQAHTLPTPIKYRRQVVLMLGTVVVAFFVCLLPFRALNLWIIFSPPEVIGELSVNFYYNLVFFCRIMLYINSAINPILYNLMSSKFRDGFMRLCGIKRCKKNLRRRGTFTTTTTTSTTCSSSHGHHRGSPDASWRRSGRSSSAGTGAGDSLRVQLQRRMSPAPTITPATVASPKESRWKSPTSSVKSCGMDAGDGGGGGGVGRGRGARVRALCHLSESFV